LNFIFVLLLTLLNVDIGIIIPGSFSGAYEEDDWISALKEVIRAEIHPNQRKTFGVCFGHQIFAHAFQKCSTDIDNGGALSAGLCVKCPHGHQAGRKMSLNSRAGSRILKKRNSSSSVTHGMFTNSDESQQQCVSVPVLDNNVDGGVSGVDELHLLYTHGDMVATLPPFAIPLATTEKVSIVSAAYFASVNDAKDFHEDKESADALPDKLRPYAVTFQAHPEYIGASGNTEKTGKSETKCGLSDTFRNVISILGQYQMLPITELKSAEEDAEQNAQCVWDDSLDVMIAAGTTLGWL
jgi:hypothetical protein